MQLVSLKKYTKIIGLVILSIVILTATILMGKNAQSMFSRASSCAVQNVSAVQVSANSAVINWESTDVTQGMVLYGTNSTDLNFSAPEGSANKSHNLPLTLLTPNTVYYYLISVGNTKCDSSGQSCNDATTCVPWSFTTAAVTPQVQIVAPILTPTIAPTLISTPTAVLQAATPTLSVSVTSSASASKSATLSVFCQQVRANIGGDSSEATKWALLKQFDIDGDGRIMGMDVLKCQSSGK